MEIGNKQVQKSKKKSSASKPLEHSAFQDMTLGEFAKQGPEYFRKKLSEEVLGKRAMDG